MYAQKTISVADELKNFYNISDLPAYRSNTYSAQVSSYDTTGGNNDGSFLGQGLPVCTAALRQPGGRILLLFSYFVSETLYDCQPGKEDDVSPDWL
jgi:hypothetical protein